MFTAMFFIYGLLQLGLFLAMLALWRRTREPIAAALMLHDLPNFWRQDIHPVCEFDLLRYGGTVREANRCFPDQPLTAAKAFPLAPVVTAFVMIGTGLILWIRRGFPGLFAGSLLMLISATPPFAKYKLDNFGEVLINGGTLWALWHFTRGRALRVV